MRPSFNEEDRLRDIMSGNRTGVPMAKLVETQFPDDNQAACETVALHFWAGIRCGAPWWELEQHIIDHMLKLTHRWLGDTRCPMCDNYWRSSNPRTTVYQGGITTQRCSKCGNLANEAVELPERPITK